METVRSACLGDAVQIRGLLRQLGYEVTLDLVEDRLSLSQRDSLTEVLVVESDGLIVAMASLHAFDLFHQPGRIGRITAFVVDAAVRRKGGGSVLLRAADSWFRQTQRGGCDLRRSWPISIPRRMSTMARYLISFPSAAMVVPDSKWEAACRDSHASPHG